MEWLALEKPTTHKRVDPFAAVPNTWWNRMVRLTRAVAGLNKTRLGYALQTFILLSGQFPRECPICTYSGRFRAAGQPPRYDATCPGCGSLERHRLLFLKCIAGGRLSGGSVLHFAPEPVFQEMLASCVDEYITADLYGKNVSLNLDIENIDLPTGSIDTIICNHVLEHVDERKALVELHRVLRRGGRLLCMVPIVEGWPETYENETAKTSAASRTLHFGQRDHVRFFGADFRTRLTDAGFSVTEYTGTGAETAKFGLLRGEKVFVGVK